MKGFKTYLNRFLILSFLLTSSYLSYSQPGIGSIPGLPSTTPVVPPINMTKEQLNERLNDKGDVATDLNAQLKKDQKITKDSLTDENGRRLPLSSRSTYGSNVFSTAANPDLAELSTPPLDYPIGVGDQIIVSGYQGAEFQKPYIVGSDGSIFPSEIGKIYVAGYTFENMRKIVYSRFASVTPVGTVISISLGQPRKINVNVVNEVNNPGIYTVSAFANAFTVIAKAGGITETGNLRNIQIKRNGRIIEELDVYEYLQSGETGRRSYLQNNDFIIIPFYEKKVLATGQFKRPMYYQLRKNEGVKALLKYSGGLNADAFASNLKIFTTKNESQEQRDVNATAILRFSNQDAPLKDGDMVKADLIKPGIINKVEIVGEVKYPSIYEIRQGDKLFDIINRAGGITKNTYLKKAYIFRGAGDSTKLTSDRIEIDLTDFNTYENQTSLNNILLVPNDRIQLFGSYEFTDRVYVEVFGEVRKPGRINKYGGMTLQDLIYLSGGLKQSAEFGRLEISSIVDVDSAKQGLKPTRTDVKSYSISSNLELDSLSSKIILKPYDQVFVRKNPTFELQQNIELAGLVKYPGLYPRLDKYEKLSSYIARAGNFKDNADLGGAVLFRRNNVNFREKVIGTNLKDSLGRDIISSDDYVSINLYKALKYKGSKFDIVLQAGDKIFVPEINPFVTVRGNVQAPLRITFDKEHTGVRYYIDKSGGFGVRPWRSRISVMYADGTSRKTRNFLFFHFYPPVDQGSIVTIPVRPQGQEISDIAKSTLTSLVPVIATVLLLKYIN